MIEPLWAQALVVLAAYALTLGLSGHLVRFFVLRRDFRPPAPDPGGPRFAASTVIGKCENLITVTLVLVGQETGLALIFAAKSLVRREEIHDNPGFYLGGTLVNLVWGLIIASVAQALLTAG